MRSRRWPILGEEYRQFCRIGGKNKAQETTDSWVLFFTKQNDYTNMQMWTNIHTTASYAQGVLRDDETEENTNEIEAEVEIECID